MKIELVAKCLELHIVPSVSKERNIESFSLVLVSVDRQNHRTVGSFDTAPEVQEAAFHFTDCYAIAIDNGFILSDTLASFVSPTGFEIPVGDVLQFISKGEEFRTMLSAVKRIPLPSLLHH